MAEIQKPYIERLKVRNFRSIFEMDLTLEPLTIFVGQNGAGKSNIVDVLRFVRDILVRGLDSAILDRNGMSALRRWSAKGRPYDVQIYLTLQMPENAAFEYGFTLGSESRGEYRVKHERAALTKNDRLDVIEIKEGRVVASTRPLERESIERLAEMQNSLVLPSILYDFHAAFNHLRNMGFYSIYPNTLREPQKPANPSPLDERGQNLASVLRALKEREQTQEILSALAKISPEISDYSVTQIGGYLVTKLAHGKDGPSFDLSQESDGTLRMLGILTALYQQPPRSLISIEEPELTIHPGALGVLCDALKEASVRSQVLITTHSPDLLYHFSARHLRVIEKMDNVTHAGPVAEYQRRAIEQKLFESGELMRIEGLQRAVTVQE